MPSSWLAVGAILTPLSLPAHVMPCVCSDSCTNVHAERWHLHCVKGANAAPDPPWGLSMAVLPCRRRCRRDPPLPSNLARVVCQFIPATHTTGMLSRLDFLMWLRKHVIGSLKLQRNSTARHSPCSEATPSSVAVQLVHSYLSLLRSAR